MSLRYVDIHRIPVKGYTRRGKKYLFMSQVQVGDSIRLTRKGIIHNDSEPIDSSYVRLSNALNGPNHYYRRYWHRRCCGSRG